MSQITSTIDDYRAGKLDFDALQKALAERRYPAPERAKNRPDDPFALEAFLDATPDYTDGTWDEVVRARNLGLLTSDEYAKISQAAWDWGHSQS